MNSNKPKVQLTGENGNVYNLMAICRQALEKAGMPDKAKEMRERILSLQPNDSGISGYDQALQIMMEYCEVH